MDTGGTLTGRADAPSQKTDELLVRTLSAMHYDALNAGWSELQAGPAALGRLVEPGAPALVSSNGRLVGAASGSQQATPKPYAIREVGGVRVGIVGVTSPNTSGAAPDPASLKSAVEALRALLPEVRRQADVIVALADLEPAEVQGLAAAGLDVQVVIGGRVLQGQELTHVGQAVVVAAGGDGTSVGRLTLQVDARGQVVAAQSKVDLLGENLADDPGIVALQAEYP